MTDLFIITNFTPFYDFYTDGPLPFDILLRKLFTSDDDLWYVRSMTGKLLSSSFIVSSLVALLKILLSYLYKHDSTNLCSASGKAANY